MNILLVGSGAREHAIAESLKRSAIRVNLFCFATNANPGIQRFCQNYIVAKLNNEQIVNFSLEQKIDLAIIGPEAPLASGIVDALAKQNISAIGPTKKLAQIEASKAFARDLLTRHKILASPKYQQFNNLHGVKEFLFTLGENFVVKADGLMGGKGVKVSGEHLFNHQDALMYCQELQAKGSNFVIEEKLIGEEFSLLSFSDGVNLVHMPPVQDHKRAFVGDLGPNTGGMGCYTDANHLLPFLTADDVKQAQAYNEATVKALYEEYGEPYRGILYGGYMVTASGVKLIEFNARFGDPEGINLLALLETDFVEICQAIIASKLNQLKVDFAKKASVCKYLVPEGYPDHPKENTKIDIAKVSSSDHIYFAAVNAKDNAIYTTSSRAIAILGIGDDIFTAEKQAEATIEKISGDLFHRKDIGTKELIDKRVKHLESEKLKLKN